jgi:hypothetical protein
VSWKTKLSAIIATSSTEAELISAGYCDATLDGIPGVVPALVPGIQGYKSPGSLGKTWDKAESLKFILIDSNFLLYPVLRPLVTLGVSPVSSKNFSFFKKIFFEEHPPGLPRGKGDGGCKRDLLASPEL